MVRCALFHSPLREKARRRRVTFSALMRVTKPPRCAVAATATTPSHDSRAYAQLSDNSVAYSTSAANELPGSQVSFSAVPLRRRLRSEHFFVPITVNGFLNRTQVNELMLKLEPMNPTDAPAKSPVLNGVWEFLYTGGLSPGTLAVQVSMLHEPYRACNVTP